MIMLNWDKQIDITTSKNKSISILNNNVLRMLDYISQKTELQDFYFYWWWVLDLILWKNIYDIDLAIQSTNQEKIENLKKILKTKWFSILHPKRYYPIWNGKIEVYLVYAENDKYFFDIAFIKNPKIFGLFNLDSIHCNFLEKKCIDRYWAIDGYTSKTIIPVKSLDWENPLCFFSHFIRLCSKYNIPIVQKEHEKFINQLTNKLNNIDIVSQEALYWSAISSIFKAIKQSKNQEKFCDELLKTEMLKIVFPELEVALKNIDKHFLPNIKDRNTMIILLNNSISWETKEWFEKKIKILKQRSWE